MSDDDGDVFVGATTEGTANPDSDDHPNESSSSSSRGRRKKKIRWCYSRFWIDCIGTCSCRPTFRAVDKIYKTDGSLEVRIIDVAASFSPPSSDKGSGSIATRLAVALWKMAIVGVQWWAMELNFFPNPQPFFFAFLTNWALIISMVYSHLSLVNTVWLIQNREERKQTGGDDEGIVPFRARLTWFFFNLGAFLQLIVTVLYWALVYEGGPSNTFNNLVHGIIFALVWIDGLVVNRIPVRMRHWLEIGFPFLVLYTIWTVLQGTVLDVRNPYYDDDFIYPVLDWEGRPWFSTGLIAGLIFVFSPIVQLLLWGASLLGRRYVDGSASTNNNNNNNNADASNKSANGNADAVDEENPMRA